MEKDDARDVLTEDWAGERGEAWAANLTQFEAMLAPIGQSLVAAAAGVRGETVLDVGCGGGATSMAVARMVGPEGTVTGLEISLTLVNATLRRCAREGASNVSVIAADAAIARLQPASYDLIMSRFGVMFFADPAAAFMNLRRAIKAKGRLVFACWAPPAENLWVSAVVEALSRHVELPAPLPRAPGPFAFAEQAYVSGILAAAGFAAPSFEPWRRTLYLGGPGVTPAAAADFVLRAMSIGNLVRAAPPEIQISVRRDIEEIYAAHATPEGIAMPASAYIVSAQPV